VVRTLLALDAKPSTVDDSGMDALMHVCTYEQRDDDEMLDILLKQSSVSITTTRRFDGSSALHIAAENDHSEATAQLLKAMKLKDVSANQRRNDGHTPLTIAAVNDYESILDLLLEAEVDVNLPHMDGRTALHFAAEHAQLSLVRRLLGAGARVDAKTSKGETALQIAKAGTSAAHAKVAARLVEAEKKQAARGRRRGSVIPGRMGSVQLMKGGPAMMQKTASMAAASITAAVHFSP
jgi:ankyrin repeat protein